MKHADGPSHRYPPLSLAALSRRAAVARWVCRFHQSIAGVHARCGRLPEAVDAAQAGIAFAIEQGLTDQQVR